VRILLISHNILGGDGQGRVNLEIARDCLAHGHQLTLVADRIDMSLVENGARWIPIHPLLDRPNLFKTPQFAIVADRMVRRLRQDLDLIVANGYVLTEAHHVNISHFVHGGQPGAAGESSSVLKPRRWYRSIYRRFNARQEKNSYRSASAVVAISHAVERELIGIGVPQHRIRVIHNGVNTEEFRPGPENPAALGLPPTGPRALFVGDIRSRRKNLDAVLRALRLVQQVRLVVVGQLQGSPYPAMARELGVGDRVTFLGYRSDVASIMRACDFLVFPTRYEPFGLVVLEALSSGLPVIVTRAAGAAEVMNPQCGFVLDDPDDIGSLGRAMCRMADAEHRRQMADGARVVACGCGWQRMADEYLRLFHSLSARG
jgi:glycosyltransferase involved in cell wall biosynthesis